jgi:hypothetical protein
MASSSSILSVTAKAAALGDMVVLYASPENMVRCSQHSSKVKRDSPARTAVVGAPDRGRDPQLRLRFV